MPNPRSCAAIAWVVGALAFGVAPAAAGNPRGGAVSGTVRQPDSGTVILADHYRDANAVVVFVSFGCPVA